MLAPVVTGPAIAVAVTVVVTILFADLDPTTEHKNSPLDMLYCSDRATLLPLTTQRLEHVWRRNSEADPAKGVECCCKHTLEGDSDVAHQ